MSLAQKAKDMWANVFGSGKKTTTFLDVWNREAAWTGGTGAIRGHIGLPKTLQITAMFACGRILGGQMGTLPLLLEEKTAHGWVEIPHHAYTRHFNHSPCPGMTPFQMIFGTVVSGIVNGHAYILKDEVGGITDFWPLPYQYVQERKEDGEFFYSVIIPGRGQVATIPPDKMIHFRAYPWDCYNSPRTHLALDATMETMAAGNEYAKSYLQNGLSVGGTVSVPTKLAPEDRARLLAEFRTQYSGTENAGKLALLEGGWTFNRFSPFTLGDAKLNDVATYAIEEASRITGVPLSWLGHPATISSVNPEIKYAELAQCLSPICEAIAQEFTLKLLDPITQGNLRFRYDLDVLSKPLYLARITANATAIQSGQMTPAESRSDARRPYIPGSDNLIIPSNTSTLGQTPGAPLPSQDKSKTIGEMGQPPNTAPKLPPVEAELPRTDLPEPRIPPALHGNPPTQGPPQPKPTAQTDPKADPKTPPAPDAHIGANGPPVDNVAATALNGAQVASLIDLVAKVEAGELPLEAAKAITAATFPFFAPEEIDKIFLGSGSIKPPQPNPAPDPAKPPTPNRQFPQTILIRR